MHQLKTKRLALFASGRGSNVARIVEYFAQDDRVEPAVIVTNKKQAGVVDLARRIEIPLLLIDRQSFYESDAVVQALRNYQVDFVVLAGFLWLVPQNLINAFSGRMVNIHPALLPKYGGKGMYGMHVHRAVARAGEQESGITIHQVSPHYDEGDIVFQARTAISAADSPEDIAAKVVKLEHQYYPQVIERLLFPSGNPE